MNDFCKSYYNIYMNNKDSLCRINFFKDEFWYNRIYNLIKHRNESFKYINDCGYQLRFYNKPASITLIKKDLYVDFDIDYVSYFLKDLNHGYFKYKKKIQFRYKGKTLR